MNWLLELQIALIGALWGRIPLPIQIQTYSQSGLIEVKYWWIKDKVTSFQKSGTSRITRKEDLWFNFRGPLLIPHFLFFGDKALPLSTSMGSFVDGRLSLLMDLGVSAWDAQNILDEIG